MQTHRDDDTPSRIKELFEQRNQDALDKLEKRAKGMVERNESAITAGKPGEKAISSTNLFGIQVTRLPDDDLALRISIGEGHGLEGSRYLVFRGDPLKVASLLQRANNAMRSFVKKVRS